MTGGAGTRSASASSGLRDRFGAPGDVVLLMGNEAMARGALEAGVSFCAGYPGNPSSEIIGTLEKWAADPAAPWPVHVEWSVNETVAVEAAAGASIAGLGALVAMKQNGLNLCADFLTTANLTGVGTGGLVVVVCDDPGPLTSSNEEDSRLYAPLFMLPMLEPATPGEARDMTAYALDLSRREGLPVLVRSVSRVSHGRAGVTLGELRPPAGTPRFDRGRPLLGLPHVVTANHRRLKERLEVLRIGGEGAEFNRYEGPARAEVLVIASGLASLYAREAVESLGLEERVGVLGLGTVWPFPSDLVAARMAAAARVLVVEQIEPFVEERVRLVHSRHAAELGAVEILGKESGHLPPVGETGTDAVAAALRDLLALPGGSAAAPESRQGDGTAAGWRREADEALASLPPREISFCTGCPHRASFWAINSAMELDGREGVVLGDIGCYGLAAGPTGFSQLKTLHCMGAGIGLGSGLGVLGKLGFEQPVLAVAGDSTFYHACLPALVNARQQEADLVFVVLDNSTTAMTGFQPHPGSPRGPGAGPGRRGAAAPDPSGGPAAPAGDGDPAWVSLPPEQVCAGIGVRVEVLDPVADVRLATEAVFRALRGGGLRVLVFRRACATWAARAGGGDGLKAWVDPDVCVADACGCDRFCARVLGCPGNRWDAEAGVAYVDPDYCDACGLCVQLCPAGALSLRGGDASADAAGIVGGAA